MKYLKRFNTLQQYINFENNNKLFTPNVSSITTQAIVEYARDNTLTFIALEAGSTVKLTKVGSPDNISLEYSIVPNEWHNCTIDTIITLEKKRDFVKFRGVNLSFSQSVSNYYQFVMTGKIRANGDVTYMLNGVGGDCALQQHCFYRLFYNCTSLVNAPALPATTLAYGCYESMFSGCTSLVSAPALPATTLSNSCYRSMFQNCTSLVSITCLATDISETNCLIDWVKNVSSTGTFTKAASMTDWSTGDSGIPTGWTVLTA